MAWNKNAKTNSFLANLLKVGLAVSSAALLFGCGGDSENATTVNNGREVGTLVDMGRCTIGREGDTVYVAEMLTDYLCQNGSWVNLTEQTKSGDNLGFSSSSYDIIGSSAVIPSGGEVSSSSSFN